MLAGHVLVVLSADADEVRTAALLPDSLRAALDLGRLTLAHQSEGDRLILRGMTNELRTALGAYLREPGALMEATLWRRVREPAPRAVSAPCFEASAWRSADRLFHRDPHWVGGDAASSVDLGGGRVLWLFGDSWIDTTGRGTRDGAHMVSNSVAIQI